MRIVRATSGMVYVLLCSLFRYSKSLVPAKTIKGSQPAVRVLHGKQFNRLMMATRMRSKPIPREVHVRRTTSSTAVYASTAVDGDSEISSMKVGEIKKELESYGISTVSFVEKSQLVEALKKARADDLKPEPK